jgi:hypothetical protein
MFWTIVGALLFVFVVLPVALYSIIAVCSIAASLWDACK